MNVLLNRLYQSEFSEIATLFFNFPYHFTLWVGQGWIIGYWSI